MSTIINATTTNGVVIEPDNSGSLVLQTNSGTTALTIDTSQNVGIGTTSPTNKLEVSGSGNTRIFATSTGNTGTFPGFIAKAGTQGNFEVVQNSGNGEAYIYNVANAAMTFATNNTERMRIDSTGNVSITQTPGKYTIDVTGGATSIANNGTVDFPNSSGMLVVTSTNTGGITIYLFGGGSTAAIGSVIGAVGTTSYNAGVTGYRWTNNTGSTGTFGFFYIRTRTVA
jgi:hypothetical protein